MDIKGALKKIYRKFVISNVYQYDVEPDVEKWISFIDKLPEPRNCFEMTFNKYRCRCQYFPFYKRLILNAAAFFGWILAIPNLMKSFGSNHVDDENKMDRLLLEEAYDVDYKDVVPPQLLKKYGEVILTKNENISYGLLTDQAKKLMKKAIILHPFHFYLNYWILKELSLHSYYREKYDPSATAVYVNERNLASPVVTRFYEESGKKYISFMHGEYLLHLIQAYFCFSEYYVWDQAYIKMFADILHCFAKQFTVYTPKKLEKKWDLEKTEPGYKYTYYFSAETVESLKKIAQIFHDFKDNGIKCKVRPHPRDSHYKLINEFFKDICIEDANKVSLEESLRDTECAVGLVTTVLSEALAEGRKVVLDNVSNPELYNNLKKRKYIILEKEYQLLSDIMCKRE